MESNEAGREEEVELLTSFFSDRTRFPPEALAKFEPHDGRECRVCIQGVDCCAGKVLYERRV